MAKDITSSYNKKTTESAPEHSRFCPAHGCPMMKSVMIDGTETCRYHAGKDRRAWPKITELLNNNIRLLDIVYNAKKLHGHEFEDIRARGGFELEAGLTPTKDENVVQWAHRVSDSVYRELKSKCIAIEKEIQDGTIRKTTGVSAAVNALTNGSLRKVKQKKSFSEMD